MSFSRFLKIFFLSFFLSAFTGCQEQLLEVPHGNENNKGANKDAISSVMPAPSDFKASHGGVKKITLSWRAVSGAKYYEIYAAEKPFDESDYEKVGEALGNEASREIELAPGSSRYLKIRAINHANVKSDFSTISIGSTLATPQISSISMDSDGTKATVSWWMENCKSDTYQNNVNFEVTAFSSDKKNIVSSVNVSGDSFVSKEGSFEAVIPNLLPKTVYYFQVEAYLKSNQTETEKSLMLDEETARRLVPLPAEDFTATQGNLKAKEVNLSWILPEMTYITNQDGSYEQRGIYFEIYRKLKDSSSDFTKLATITPEPYTPGEMTAYTDSDPTLEQGVQYTYKIVSYTNGTGITSDSSVAQTAGWIIAVPVLHAKGSYNEDSEGNYTSISFAFEADFEAFGTNYKYILQQTKKGLTDDSSDTSTLICSNSLAEINSFTKEYNPAEDKGYYSYNLYVCPQDSQEPSQALASTLAPGKFVVTDSSDSFPNIENLNFTVEDGFKDKFKISWRYMDGFAFILHWSENGIENTINLDPADYTVSEGTAIYTHPAESGEKRLYNLEVSNGLSSTTENTEYSYTLGTPAISVPASKQYDSISFSWAAVQKAKSYKIHAYYSDDPLKQELSDLDYKAFENPETHQFTCQIDNPRGYNDGSLAGKAVTVSVTALSECGDSITDAAQTALLGPALISAELKSTSANAISISWSKIPGAAGYRIYRAIYKDGTAQTLYSEDSFDSIFVSADGKTIKDNSGENVNGVLTRAVAAVSDSNYVLQDIYAEANDSTNNYQKNQSKLSWGLPFKYFVVPVLSEEDFPEYENQKTVTAATYGYGLNVRASKADHYSKVTITWTQPYGASKKSPALYRRPAGSSSDYWTCAIKSISSSSDSEISIQEDFIAESASRPGLTSAYEYAVLYNGTNSSGDVFAKSYITDLCSKKDPESPEEYANKGYILSLEDISAITNSVSDKASEEFYSEKVSWTPYNYTDRYCGPSYYELQIKNLNKSPSAAPERDPYLISNLNETQWTTIARITPDLTKTEKDYGFTAVDVSKEADAIRLTTPSTCTAIVTPEFTDNVSSGVLQVLRDARHFYRLVAVRTFTKNGSEYTVKFGTDDSKVFAYRQIKSEELCKIGLLQYSYAIYEMCKGNKWSSAQENTHDFADGGNYKVRKDWGKIYYRIIDFNGIQNTPGNAKMKLPVKITTTAGTHEKDETVAQINDGAINESYYTWKIYDVTLSLTADEIPANVLDSYQGTIRFSADSSKNAAISVTQTEKTPVTLTARNSADERRKLIPLRFNDDDNAWYMTSETYGWWN